MGWSGKLWGKQRQNALTYSDEEDKIFAASRQISLAVVWCAVAGMIMIVIWAYGVVLNAAGSVNLVLAFLGTDALVAAAAAAAGALFGFIFGIPRTLDPASRAAVATAASQAGPAAASHALMAANTNLERISDWLTTLLIGATLVQIKDIAKWIGSLGQNLMATGPAANDAVVPIIVIYFFALSFLGVYLITRLYLTSAFQQTLGLLAGGGLPSTIDFSELKKKLEAAAKSGSVADLKTAMEAYDAWHFSDAKGDDPELNANVTRILAQLLAKKAEPLPSDIADKLKKAVAKAATDSAIKAQLKNEDITTGIPNLDNDIKSALT